MTLTAGGEAEKLAEELQKGCPAFFREDDRIFYRASGLLQQAESGQSSPVERADLAREALRLMMQVGPPSSTPDYPHQWPAYVYLTALQIHVKAPHQSQTFAT